MSVKNTLQLDEAKGELVVATPTKIDLRNAHAIRRELANVYRDMRSGNIEAAEGTKLAYVLDMVRKSYESSVLEERLKQIESTMRRRK